ncbi:TPA: hypothetical protein QCR38_003908 [Bacillus cereus]|nr:hypothetical protein [Bacillus cereus]
MIKKKIDIDVVNKTWKVRGKKTPANLTKFTGSKDINVLLVMLNIAIRTRPPLSYGFALGDMWAWFRYFPAISPNRELRLRPEWEEIDSHQKTILSDDWGVGFASYVLTEALDLVSILPTNFILNHSPYFSLGSAGGKKGPKKSPDFIALDRSMRCHIFECKGTQTSVKAMKSQFNTGSQQKKNVNDPKGLIDERLVVGLFVPQDKNKDKALLKIEDPELDINLEDIEKKDLIKTILIGDLAVCFHLLGFPKVANAIALNEKLEDGVETREKKEIALLTSERINQKEYKYTKMMFRFDDSNEENTLYGLEAKFGIEKSVIDKIFNCKSYSDYIDEIYNNFDNIPPWKIEENELGIKATTPLGLYVEINTVY